MTGHVTGTDLSYTPKSEYALKSKGTQSTSKSGGPIFPVDPTKGEMKDIMMLVYFMTMMSDTYKNNLSGLKDGMNTYIFDQNLQNAGSLDDVFQTCMRYLTQDNPEAAKLVNELKDLLQAGSYYYNSSAPGVPGLEAIKAIKRAVPKVVGQLKDLLNDAKNQPHSDAATFALAVVTSQGKSAAEVIVGSKKIDPNTAPYNTQMAVMLAGQQQDEIKQRLESVKTIAQNMQQMEKTLSGLLKIVTSSNGN